MVSINYASREVCCKIVYYGPGLSGKTTNLQYVHAKVPGSTKGDLISLATEADRTLYFDFLPINIGTINGFAAKFQLYTVPGQVYYNATRKLVLRGVDGLVFVADSQPDKLDENIESLQNLEDNLKEFGYQIDDMPMVIQYNKRDLPGVMSVDELNEKINVRGLPHFEASASIGNGVFDTLKLIIKLVLDKAKSSGGSSAATVSQAAPEAKATPAVTTPAPVAASGVAASGVAASAKAVSASPQSGPEQSPTPILSTGSVSTAAQAPSVETDETDRQRTPAYRPFPGSEAAQAKAAERKISPTAFAPAREDDTEDSILEKKVIEEDSHESQGSQTSLVRPLMAPSLRRREMKKRGFFKRLFGVK